MLEISRLARFLGVYPGSFLPWILEIPYTCVNYLTPRGSYSQTLDTSLGVENYLAFQPPSSLIIHDEKNNAQGQGPYQHCIKIFG